MAVFGFFILFFLVVAFIGVQLFRLAKKFVPGKDNPLFNPSADQPVVVREKPFSSYTVIDVGTDGADTGSGDIVQLAALRVREGYEVDSFCAFVSPTGDIPDTAANADYLTESTVVCVPVLKNALESFIGFIGDDLLIGYNIASFDLPLLQRNLSAELNKKLGNAYIDVHQMAGEAHIPVDENNLAALAEYFKLPVDKMHDMPAHCHTTKKCFERLLTMVQPAVKHSADIAEMP